MKQATSEQVVKALGKPAVYHPGRGAMPRLAVEVFPHAEGIWLVESFWDQVGGGWGAHLFPAPLWEDDPHKHTYRNDRGWLIRPFDHPDCPNEEILVREWRNWQRHFEEHSPDRQTMLDAAKRNGAIILRE